MRKYRRLLSLILILVGATIAVAAMTIGILYVHGAYPGDAAGIDFQQSFSAAALTVGVATLPLIAAAALLLFYVAKPMLSRAGDSESRYRHLFDHVGIGTVVYTTVEDGKDFVFEDMNRAIERSENIRREDVIGRRLTEVYPRAREFGLIDVLARVWRTGRAESMPAWLYSDEIRTEWRESFVYRLPNGHVVALFSDISERKQAEAGMRESELRMRALLDASRDEILLVSTAGIVLAINRAARTRLAARCAGRELVGASLSDMLPEEQAEQRLTTVRHVAKTNALVHYSVQIRNRWFEFWFYPVARPDGYVSEVAVYAREVTEQKKSEADLRKLFQAIQQSPVSVIITDLHGTIEYVNPKFTEATGYALPEAIGKTPRILKSGHTRPEEYAQLWRTIRSGGVWSGEFHNRKKSGELFWELASIAPVKGSDGRITNYVGVKEDITERKEIEEQLRQSQKMQALGQLTGGIAHDFNNLLAIIIGNLQLLGERTESDPSLRDLLDDAVWSAQRGAELTHRLLAFARRQPLKPDALDLNAVIRGLSALLRRTLGGGIDIREMPAADLWMAFADRGELENALVNLAVNARDAMQNTGVLTLETHNITLGEAYADRHEEIVPGDYVMLTVTDSGAGMTPEVMQHVFEPFFTTKDVGKGSGLGLSMVYGFVKQSGGHVSIDSRVGQGTSVKLYLPRIRMPVTPSDEVSSDYASVYLRNRVVLVVEDEPKLRKVAVKMLDKLGLTILQAETAEEALQLLRFRRVDVLFTDIELPGEMNGANLADAAEAIDPGIKVLFTTGYAPDTVLDARSARKNAWLLKPYSQRDLIQHLNLLLQ